jgi:drug/metabolite transporter (DMT)-like permease
MNVGVAYVAALGSALGYGISAYLGAIVARRFGPWVTSIGTQTAGLAFIALLAVPTALAGLPTPAPGEVVALVTIGLAVAGLNLVAYRLLIDGPVSVIYPILASNQAVVSVLAVLFFGDVLSALQALGLVCVTAGVLAAAYGGRSDTEDGPGRPVASAPADTGGPVVAPAGVVHLSAAPQASPRMVGVAVAAAVGSGVVLFALAHFTKVLGWYVPVVIDRGAQVGLFFALLAAGMPWRPRYTDHTPRAWALLLGVGVLDGAALVLYALANEHGPTSVVATVTSAFVVIPTVLGILLLRERPRRHQLGGLVAVIAGLLMLGG